MSIEIKEGEKSPFIAYSRLSVWLRHNLNFFRLHLLYLYVGEIPSIPLGVLILFPSIFTPLIFSAIFYASNGDIHISYIDALFNCISSICVIYVSNATAITNIHNHPFIQPKTKKDDDLELQK